MTKANVIAIEITTTDKAGLAKLSRDAHKVGEEIEKGLGRGVDAAERKARESADKTSKSYKESAVKIDKSFDMAARQVGRYMYQIEREAWASGEGMDGAFSAASRKIRSDLDDIRKQAAKTGAGLESDLGGALKDVAAQADKLKSSIDSGDDGGLIEGLIGDIPKGAALAAGAGAVVGAALLGGMQQSMQETRIGGMIAAQTGQATAAAEQLGTMTGNIYAGNFGESLEQVGEAITSLFQNEVVDTSSSQAEVQKLTEKVLTLSQTTGDAVGEITHGAQQLVLTGLAGSFAEALDIIQRATEIGLNSTGELLDTINEYSVQFERMGLSGAEAFGLIEQATDAGARNIDIVADAIKEFSVLAQDAGSNAARGFKALGMEAGDAMAAVAAGGAPAKEVLRDVLNRLQEMPPSVQRTTAAVDLFGTKAEDLGNSLYAMDVDTVAESFGDFAGSVDRAGKSIEDSTPGLDKLGRWFSDRASDIGGGIVAGLDTMAEGFTLMGEAAFGSGDALDESGDSMEDWGSETWEANDAAQTLVQSIDDLIAAQSGLADTYMNSAEAQIDYNRALVDANDLAKNFSGGLNDTATGFDLTSEAGQKAQETIDELVTSGWDMVEALSADGASAEHLNAVITDSNTKLYDLLVSMGLDAEAARHLADRLFGIPDVDPTVTVIDNASPKITDITNKLNGLSGKWINTYVNTIFKQTGTAPAGSPAGGGGLLGSSGGNAYGGIARPPQWGAATGGARHSSTLINEVGPEVADLPNGTRMLTAGATRALADAGALGGGGGGVAGLTWVGPTTGLIYEFVKGLRVVIKNEHGGDVLAALGQGR
jgi:phage-related minor tail protein